MKYSIEYRNGKFIETLEVDNNIVTKTWQREERNTISALRCHDLKFSKQLEELLDEDALDFVNDLFDGSMLVADIEDFIANTGIE